MVGTFLILWGIRWARLHDPRNQSILRSLALPSSLHQAASLFIRRCVGSDGDAVLDGAGVYLHPDPTNIAWRLQATLPPGVPYKGTYRLQQASIQRVRIGVWSCSLQFNKVDDGALASLVLCNLDEEWLFRGGDERFYNLQKDLEATFVKGSMCSFTKDFLSS